tara:strand:- start:2646 stop:2885 length:240 start_codon:yes stop_codon:yes gene_type:complete
MGATFTATCYTTKTRLGLKSSYLPIQYREQRLNCFYPTFHGHKYFARMYANKGITQQLFNVPFWKNSNPEKPIYFLENE